MDTKNFPRTVLPAGEVSRENKLTRLSLGVFLPTAGGGLAYTVRFCRLRLINIKQLSAKTSQRTQKCHEPGNRSALDNGHFGNISSALTVVSLRGAISWLLGNAPLLASAAPGSRLSLGKVAQAAVMGESLPEPVCRR